MSLPLRPGKRKMRKKNYIYFKDWFQVKTHDLVTKVFRMLKKTDFCGWKRAKRSTEPPVPCSCLQQNIAWEGENSPWKKSRRWKEAGWEREWSSEHHLLLNSRLKAVKLLFRNCHRLGSISNDLKRDLRIYAYKIYIYIYIYTHPEM